LHLFRILTRNSAVADKLRDAFVQIHWRVWRKNTPIPMCSPCRIWLFCIKGCGLKYRRTPKIGECSWDERRGWPQESCPCPTCYHVIFGSSAI